MLSGKRLLKKQGEEIGENKMATTQQDKKTISSFDEKITEARVHLGYANSYLKLAIKRLNKLTANNDAAESKTKIETSIDEMTILIKELKSIGKSL